MEIFKESLIILDPRDGSISWSKCRKDDVFSLEEGRRVAMERGDEARPPGDVLRVAKQRMRSMSNVHAVIRSKERRFRSKRCFVMAIKVIVPSERGDISKNLEFDVEEHELVMAKNAIKHAKSHLGIDPKEHFSYSDLVRWSSLVKLTCHYKDGGEIPFWKRPRLILREFNEGKIAYYHMDFPFENAELLRISIHYFVHEIL